MTPEEAKKIDSKFHEAEKLRTDASSIEHRLLEDNGWYLTCSGTPRSQWMWAKGARGKILLGEKEIKPMLLLGKEDALLALKEEMEENLPEETES